ncbi:MAG: vWA domain-containing protein [Stellaceae bacterium]
MDGRIKSGHDILVCGTPMVSQAPASPTDREGRLVANLMHFARALRAAGLPVGPGKVIDAVAAVETVGITDRRDFYWTLHAVFVNRPDQRPLFDQAFHVFWRNPELLKKMMGLVLPETHIEGKPEESPEMLRRLAEALHPGGGEEREPQEQEIELDAAMTFSDRERLRGMDFEKMSLDELARAKAAIARMHLATRDIPTRRFRPDRRGARADLRASLRASLRSGGIIELKRKNRRLRPPPLIVICDISGSMSRYSRLFLHFMHSVTNDRDRVHAFVFGTRLTNITRYLKYRDVDLALERVGEAVSDWSGGTRIGHCLAEFNRLWSRRVLGQGAVVLLITDGLDRDAGTGLAREMDRLHHSCRRLIWLNPLLRYEGFEPRSLGMRAMLPHVDAFRPVHNLASLEELIAVLSAPPPARRGAAVAQWSHPRHSQEERAA